MAPDHQTFAFVENIAVRPDATATDVIQHRRSSLWGGDGAWPTAPTSYQPCSVGMTHISDHS